MLAQVGAIYPLEFARENEDRHNKKKGQKPKLRTGKRRSEKKFKDGVELSCTEMIERTSHLMEVCDGR